MLDFYLHWRLEPVLQLNIQYFKILPTGIVDAFIFKKEIQF